MTARLGGCGGHTTQLLCLLAGTLASPQGLGRRLLCPSRRRQPLLQQPGSTSAATARAVVLARVGGGVGCGGGVGGGGCGRVRNRGRGANGNDPSGRVVRVSET